jgi:glycosyltransferase involved in cell wall biosynthesis
VKILQVHNRYQQRSGEEVVVEAEAELLASRGHTVVRYERDSAEIHDYNALQKMRLALTATWARDSCDALTALIVSERPDVAHFHNTFPLVSPAAYRACTSHGVPVVQTVHNYRLLCPAATLLRRERICEDCVGRTPWPSVVHGCYHGSRLQSLIAGSSLVAHRAIGTYRKHVQRYIALTAFGRAMLVRGGFSAERILVKPNFVVDPGLRTEAGSYVLYLGRLAPEKGVLLALDAWKQLPHVPLRIVGDGPLRAQVEARARALRHVEVLRSVPHAEIFQHLRGARALIFPSIWYEGQGLTIVEAFATGVPVIASALGAPLELLEGGSLGTLFKPGDANDLAAKVAEVFLQGPQILEKTRLARARYESSNFTAHANYRALLAAYESANRQLVQDRALPGS